MLARKNSLSALCLDYGSKTIGLAIGQSITGTAQELPEIRNLKSGKPNWDVFTHTVEEWKPDLFIVGLPLNMDGSPSEFCKIVQRFARQLEGRYQKKVVFMDERLSTAEAKSLTEKHSGNYRKNPVDSTAARLILESWFREQNINADS